jgi:hypothetical protein
MYLPCVYIIDRKYLNSSAEKTETHSRKEPTPMNDPKPNIFYEELRAEEYIVERKRLTDDKLSRGAALVVLAIVLIIVIGGIILFLALH